MAFRGLLALALLLLAPAALPAAQALPVLVVDVTQAPPAQHLLAVSLQGLANRHPDGPRVFLLTNPRDEEWLHYCLRLAPRTIERVSVEQLLAALKPELKAQIIYDPDQPYTLNVATTAAGVQEAVISAADLGLPTVLDLRNRWRSAAEAYEWAEASLLPECDRSRAALLPAGAIAMRDLAIQERMFTFAAPAPGEEAWFQSILTRLAPGTAIYGDAPASIRPGLSRASHYFVSAAAAANLSFLSRLEAGPSFHQYVSYVDPTAPRYLALIFDCSDLGFAINDMPAVWEPLTRGSLPLGWALPAALAHAAPPVLQRYYDDAYRSGVDGFVLGPNGAGEMDVAAAGAPYAFYRATSQAQSALDAHAVLYAPQPGAADLGAEVSTFAGQTGARGVFVVTDQDFEPRLLDGIPVVAAPRVDSAGAAITYLNRIPLDRRFAALCLNPRLMTPRDAAHIAGHVAQRFVAVAPEQMVDLMRTPSEPSQPGEPTASISSVDYPSAPLDPSVAVPVKAAIEAPEGISSAVVMYSRAGNPRPFYQWMEAAGSEYRASLPPLLCGGELSLSIRVLDPAGRASWSPAWTMQVTRVDSDDDGLSDAEEQFLLTDPQNPDTDGDGLLDGADPTPLRPDRIPANYLGPITPPSDLPYLPEPGETTADLEGRHLRPGQSCLYWLPLTLVPTRAPAVVALDAVGTAALALSADPAQSGERFSGQLTGGWHSPILAGAYPGGVFLRAACPPDATGELLVRSLAVVSPPDAPSIGGIAFSPAHPGPEQQIVISAAIFSPKRIGQAALTYRINGRGEITVPMPPVGGSQRYQASIPGLDNRDELEWWISARDREGAEADSAPAFLPIGARPRETVSLLAAREFIGDWSSSADWDNAGRTATAAGLRDSAAANLTGGTYAVWMLAGGRGQGVTLMVDGNRAGAIDPDQPDGWQQVGRVRLDSGRHRVQLISERGPRAPLGAAPRYAAVVLSADPTFRPPGDRVLDIYNSLTLLAPRPDDTLTGRVELRATSAGNITGLEFSLDGQPLRSVSGPPFTLSLNTQRLPNGPHRLKLHGVQRVGGPGLDLEIPVTIAN